MSEPIERTRKGLTPEEKELLQQAIEIQARTEARTYQAAKERTGEIVRVVKPRKVVVQKSVAELNGRHRQIARLAALGHRNEDIAEEVGLAPSTVAQVKSSPAVKGHIQGLQTVMDAQALEARAEVHEMLPDAIAALKDLVRDPDTTAAVRLGGVKTIFGIAGLEPVKKLDITSKQAILTGEDYERIRQRAVESAKASGEIIDVST